MPQITPELASARLRALHLAPYYASALWRLIPVPTPGLGTMGVDKDWRLYYDPATLAQWGPALAGGVLTHEVGHLLRGHHDRAAALGTTNPTIWNYATDAAINDDLIRAGFTLPEGVVTPQALGLADNGIEEAYYAALMQDSDLATGSDQDESDSCGSGAGGHALPCERPTRDAAGTPALSPAQQRATRRQVAQAVRDHTPDPASGIGDTPAGLRRWADETLAPPQVDWRTELRSTVRRAITYAAGKADWSFTRRSRRCLPGVILPGMRAPVVSVAAVVDTSGSMSPRMLSAALGELAGLMKAGANRSLNLVTCDTDGQVSTGVHSVEQVELIGGGGTDMRVGIGAALSCQPRPDVVVVLTDGMTSWPDRALPVPLIVALIGDYDRGIPDWARTVRVTD